MSRTNRDTEVIGTAFCHSGSRLLTKPILQREKDSSTTVGSTFRHFRLSLVGSRYDISYIAIH
jgi:hypothetical protein